MTAWHRFKRFVGVLAWLVLVSALASCARDPEPTLRIGTNVWIGSEPL